MDEYMLEEYEDYMASHCTCDRSDEECQCLSYDDFCTMRIEKLKEEWAEVQFLDYLDGIHGAI